MWSVIGSYRLARTSRPQGSTTCFALSLILLTYAREYGAKQCVSQKQYKHWNTSARIRGKCMIRRIASHTGIYRRSRSTDFVTYSQLSSANLQAKLTAAMRRYSTFRRLCAKPPIGSFFLDPLGAPLHAPAIPTGIFWIRPWP